jgi:hypothetical protein
VASGCCWAGELRITLTNPDKAPARSIAFYSAAGETPESVMERLLADFREWEKANGKPPLLRDLSPWLFEEAA